MVYYKLKITADTENVASLSPTGGCDNPSFPFHFKLRCECCGEVSPKETCLCLEQKFVIPRKRRINFKERTVFEYPSRSQKYPFYENTPVPRTPGQFNGIQECKLCSRVGKIAMIPGVGRPLSQQDSVAAKYVPLMAFECHGLEPVDYSFVGPMWTVKTNSGKIYEGVDLSEGHWDKFDEEDSKFVLVANLKSKFDVVKGWKYREAVKPDKSSEVKH